MLAMQGKNCKKKQIVTFFMINIKNYMIFMIKSKILNTVMNGFNICSNKWKVMIVFIKKIYNVINLLMTAHFTHNVNKYKKRMKHN